MERVINEEQKAKLKQLVQEGIGVNREVKDLNAGLNETIKSVAEELEIKPGILKKAIQVAGKGNFADVEADFDTLDTLLDTVGKK